LSDRYARSHRKPAGCIWTPTSIPDEVEKLHDDIAYLLYPSRDRALTLNKACQVLGEEQSFIYGRDATVTPQANVHKTVRPDQRTGISDTVWGP